MQAQKLVRISSRLSTSPIKVGAILLTLGLVVGLWSMSLSAQSLLAVPVARGTGGAVAAEDYRAAEIGLNVLKSGGNAIDAAVATAAALGVVKPFASGIGGGGFMLIYLADQDRVVALDGREQAPATASVEMFRDPDDPTGGNLPFYPNRITNGAAVGVPGTLLTWAGALQRYGTRSLAEMLAPSIELAEQGFEVDAVFARQVADKQAQFAALTSTAALYLPHGQPPDVGSRLKNPDLAATFRQIADQGVNAFYRGEIGEAIVAAVNQPPTVANPPFPIYGGGMTLTDLDQYDLRVRTPVQTIYRGYRLYGMGLPSSGGITTSQVLNLLAGDDLGTLPPAQVWHQIIEAERLAYADRNAYLGDPEYVDVPLAGLLSPDYAIARRSQLPDQPTPAAIQTSPGNPLTYQIDVSPSLTGLPPISLSHSQEGQSTTHLTVADGAGNLVAYTLTLESLGGSGIVVPGYGFLLNNELTDFNAIAPHPNAPEPGKRPRSSIAPTLVLSPDGRTMAFGSPGGSTIITTVLGIAINLIDFGLPLDQAIAAPRISQRDTGPTQIDQGYETSDVGQALAAMGHSLTAVAEIGAATGIVRWPDGTLLAATEPIRRGGGAALVVHPER